MEKKKIQRSVVARVAGALSLESRLRLKKACNPGARENGEQYEMVGCILFPEYFFFFFSENSPAASAYHYLIIGCATVWGHLERYQAPNRLRNRVD